MSAEPRILRTDAEQALIAAYEAARPDLPGGQDVLARRDAAFALFRQAGLPHRRVEAWKYTDLRALLHDVSPIARKPDDDAARAAMFGHPDPFAGLGRYRLVLVDGFFVPALSDVDALAEEGVVVLRSSELWANEVLVPIAGAPSLVDTSGLAEGDVAIALNTMFAADGITLVARDGTAVTKPVEILHLTTSATAAASRHAVVVGSGATLRVIETHWSADGVGAQANVVVGIDVRDGAKVGWTKVQAAGDEAVHLGSLLAKVGEGASFDHLTLTTGGSLSRSQSFVSLGENARLGLNGATMAKAKQHADVTLLIQHALPGTTSRVAFRNVADGSADGVFQGKIIVAEGAQKTDGKMMAKQLLLSEEAAFVSKPELEIYADDVQCGHGSTSGRIDETMLFYLLTRGVPRPDAERLLLQAFLSEAVEAMDDEELRPALEAVIETWLARRGG